MIGTILRSSRCAILKVSPIPRSGWAGPSHVRRLATAAASGDASNLPLAGIKVLDMTRVLAGVSFEPRVLFFFERILNSAAILYTNTGRSWVRHGLPCMDQRPQLATWTY
jgi:hypothetical protein